MAGHEDLPLRYPTNSPRQPSSMTESSPSSTKNPQFSPKEKINPQTKTSMATEANFKSKNLEAERKRRAKLKAQFFALRALVPRITKARETKNPNPNKSPPLIIIFTVQMSKESTLGDAINYILELLARKEQLQTELQEMEDEQLERLPSPELVDLKEEVQVEVKLVGKKSFKASVYCRKKTGSLRKLAEAVSGLGLEITGVSFVSMGVYFRVLLSMEAGDERAVSGDRVRDLMFRVMQR